MKGEAGAGATSESSPSQAAHGGVAAAVGAAAAGERARHAGPSAQASTRKFEALVPGTRDQTICVCWGEVSRGGREEAREKKQEKKKKKKKKKEKKKEKRERERKKGRPTASSERRKKN